jgi:hypothetical protein
MLPASRTLWQMLPPIHFQELPPTSICLKKYHLPCVPKFSNYFLFFLSVTSETALAQCPAAFRPLVQLDLNAAWAAIGTATVDDQARTTAWQNWTAYAHECPPSLASLPAWSPQHFSSYFESANVQCPGKTFEHEQSNSGSKMSLFAKQTVS